MDNGSMRRASSAGQFTSEEETRVAKVAPGLRVRLGRIPSPAAPPPPTPRTTYERAATVGSVKPDAQTEAWLSEYQAEVQARGRDPIYISEIGRNVRLVLSMTPRPLTQTGLTIALGELMRAGRSSATINHHLRDLKSFLNWCVRNQYLPHSPAAAIRPYKATKDRRHRRGAFTDEQIRALLAHVAASKWTFKGVTGPERAEIYHMAVCTGLRAGTLRLLTAGQLHVGPDERVPHVRVLAEQLKDAEDLVVPIQKDAAARIHAAIQGKKPTDTALSMPANKYDWTRMLRRDLAAAGITYCTTAELPNGQLRRSNVLDFHSLRVTFATRCALAGIPLTVVQKWMGHSDPKLTANIYAQVGLLDDASASLALLPSLADPRRSGESSDQVNLQTPVASSDPEGKRAA